MYLHQAMNQPDSKHLQQAMEKEVAAQPDPKDDNEGSTADTLQRTTWLDNDNSGSSISCDSNGGKITCNMTKKKK